MKKRDLKKQPAARDTGQRPGRVVEIDLLKGLAIISVIIIHTWYQPILYGIGAPFSIGQAVPVLILIAGFTSAYAYLRYDAKTIRECYEPSLITRRLRRIIQPFVLIWIIQILIAVLLLGQSYTILSLVINFVSGGNGPGSFFIPLIIQHIFIVPVLFLLALRYPGTMLAVTFVLDLIMEILMISAGIPSSMTELFYARYLFAGALGVYLATASRPRAWMIATGGIAGFLYIYLTNYTRLFPALVPANITDGVSHAPAYLWTLVVVTVGFAVLPKKALTRVCRSLALVGKSSLHIFLVQMTVFWYFWGPIQVQVLEPLARLSPKSFNIFVLLAGAVIMIAICCGIGCAWFSAAEKLDKLHTTGDRQPQR